MSAALAHHVGWRPELDPIRRSVSLSIAPSLAICEQASNAVARPLLAPVLPDPGRVAY
jgi:hypothetical protein